MDVYCT